jgi:hypothetical protein
MYRDAIEAGLVRLKRYWERWRPDIPFPLEVGGAFLGWQMQTQIQTTNEEDPGELFTESINALARASGTNAEDWGLAQGENGPRFDLK